ncbi:zinc-binding alcohol dehydrogenase family protein [Kitasatospora purpeofusca]|uniref:zinc-binding alcohol dehydrogenase family protein n=1 Tax=Kitasatospora purpeofusca TaxID=67352 RepID=UPI00225B5642|nr:zinc-binding alcohol dehydrogenase family protein [Kitasatospora purpeofusca]MCX4755736.1 zinc-binding alcohol dehydrogenase family protein [Kitasatospora purpeofusca]WSR36403.1 zinc-binding alcohol dehydrogenase family protein [Kitasatospora purpeofusca]WSR44688.1 zinc-binding alcohol dehydrogenase family protein [Kitasatospora purpeofusca]
MNSTAALHADTGAWVVDRPGPVNDATTGPLVWERRPLEALGPHEILVEVEACGVCRTDLHLAEGDLPPRATRCTPGHEAVGRVRAVGTGVDGFAVGERAGVAWLAGTCGACGHCRNGRENLCPDSRYTGWDRPGGYADRLTADADYAYHLDEDRPAEELAPLLCAGIIGYRALERAELPPGGLLGIYGFGASAHLTAQLALARGGRVAVFTRAPAARRLALDLGAEFAGDSYDPSPEPLAAAVLFAPVGGLVPVALAALDRGGTLSVAGIHLTDIPALNYRRHLFQERTLRSVTANTRADGAAYLAEAARTRPVVRVRRYPLRQADTALADLAADRVTGVAVLVPG